MIKAFNLDTLRRKRRKTGSISVSAPARMWVTNDIRDFAVFWPRSNRLGEARCYAFQCADILELHCETFIPALKANPWFVAIVNEKNEPLALFPFMIEHGRHIRVLRFMDGALSDYNAPVLFPPTREWNAETVHIIWQGLRNNLPFDVANWEKVPASVGDLQNPLTLLTLLPQGYSSHLVTLSGTWEEFSARLPRRKELSRKTRRLSQRGMITFEVAETPEQYDILLAALIRQKRQRDLDARGFDSLDRPGFRSYLMAARGLVHPSGPVALFALKVNDTIVAAHWGYIVGARFFSLIPSFEGGEWYAYSPGFLLADKIFEWCFAKGFITFDYGIGDEAYKREYCDVVTLLYRTEIPSTVWGQVYLPMRNAKQWLAKTRLWIFGALSKNDGEITENRSTV